MTTRYYYWLVAADPETHKPYLVMGSDKSEGDARIKGMEMLPGVDFQIKRLPTKDIGSASAMIRGKRLETTHSLKEASKKLGHEKSIARDRKRKLHKSKSDQTTPMW